MSKEGQNILKNTKNFAKRCVCEKFLENFLYIFSFSEKVPKKIKHTHIFNDFLRNFVENCLFGKIERRFYEAEM